MAAPTTLPAAPTTPAGATPAADVDQVRRRLATAPRRSYLARRAWEWAFYGVCALAIVLTLGVTAVLTSRVVSIGVGALDVKLLTKLSGADDPEDVGILAAVVGSFVVTILCGLMTLPIGVATAVFLEEYRPRGRVLRRLHGLINLNITNLAGIPSIVYGIIGLSLFVFMFGVFGGLDEPAFEIGHPVLYQTSTVSFPPRSVRFHAGEGGGPPALVDGMEALMGEGDTPTTIRVLVPGEPTPKDKALAARTVRAGAPVSRLDRYTWYHVRLPLGRGLLAGALTLMLVVLPMVIIASQEAIRAVPDSLREAAHGLGATKWQTIRQVVLPQALPGIMTGMILAMSRAIGETAPLLIVVGTASINYLPTRLTDRFTVLPLTIFFWTRRPNAEEFESVTSAAILVLLVILLTINSGAIAVRTWARRKR